MCVHINTGILRLVQQFLQIKQIMAGNQNTRPSSDADIDFRYFRIAKRLGIRRIEKRHRFDCRLSAFENQSDKLFGREFASRSSQSLEKELKNGFVCLTQHGRVIGVCGNPFDTVREQFAQRTDIFVFTR